MRTTEKEIQRLNEVNRKNKSSSETCLTKADLNDEKATNRKSLEIENTNKIDEQFFFSSTIDVDKPRSSITNFYYSTFVELPLHTYTHKERNGFKKKR